MLGRLEAIPSHNGGKTSGRARVLLLGFLAFPQSGHARPEGLKQSTGMEDIVILTPQSPYAISGDIPGRPRNLAMRGLTRGDFVIAGMLLCAYEILRAAVRISIRGLLRGYGEDRQRPLPKGAKQSLARRQPRSGKRRVVYTLGGRAMIHRDPKCHHMNASRKPPFKMQVCAVCADHPTDEDTDHE